ncbi:MAG: hypothetical protein ACLQJR_00315 [Stellaceae bacterium]
MSSVGWAIVLVGLALAVDVVWSELRARKSRRAAKRRASTLTSRYGLPRQ